MPSALPIKLSQLRVEDLERCAVWEFVGASDTEAVLLPRADVVLHESDVRVFVAATDFLLANGTMVLGFCSPGDPSGFDYTQPVVIVNDVHVPLWRARGWTRRTLARVLTLAGTTIDRVFPLTFSCRVSVDATRYTGSISAADIIDAGEQGAAR